MAIDIETLRTRLLVKYPFFGSIIANVNFKEANITSNGVPTAATDGNIVYLNPKLAELYDDEELLFIICHEICHIAFNHIFRSEGKNKKIWNIATDAVINQFLKKDGLKLVAGVVNIAEAINYDAETMYDILLERNRQNKQNQNGQSGTTESQGGGQAIDDGDSEYNEGHDSHDMWEDAVKKYKEEKDNEDKTDSENADGRQNGNDAKNVDNNNSSSDEVKSKQDELSKMGEKEVFKRNTVERKKQLEKLKNNLNKQIFRAGSQSSNGVRDITDIGRARPIVDWRFYLYEATKFEYDWSYKNAYIEDGLVKPRFEAQKVADTEILLDTSASVSTQLLKNFLRECKNILYYSRMKVGCFDVKFHGFKEIRNEADIEKLEFKSGGGTNFDAAVNAFTKRTENKIVFTDGEADMPKKSVRAIWIVYGENKINPPGGKVIYISNEDYRKLCYSTYNDSVKKTR